MNVESPNALPEPTVHHRYYIPITLNGSMKEINAQCDIYARLSLSTIFFMKIYDSIHMLAKRDHVLFSYRGIDGFLDHVGVALCAVILQLYPVWVVDLDSHLRPNLVHCLDELCHPGRVSSSEHH